MEEKIVADTLQELKKTVSQQVSKSWAHYWWHFFLERTLLCNINTTTNEKN